MNEMTSPGSKLDIPESTPEIKEAHLSRDDRREELKIMKSVLSSTLLPILMSSSTSSISNYSLVSAKPMYSYSPTDKSSLVNDLKIGKVIEELVGSEEIYINALRMLQDFYIEPILLEVEFDIAIPFHFLSLYLKILIVNHNELLSNLKQIIVKRLSLEDLAAKIAIHICNYAIDVSIYKQFCQVYDDVIIIMKSDPKQGEWFGGWEKFLESTQPISRNMDLSFMSLIQRPTSRIGKYRLILESLCKHANGSQHENLSLHLDKLRHHLNHINDYSRYDKVCEKNKLINEFIDFKAIRYKTPLSLEFFGTCLLVGTVFVVWIEEDHCVLAQCGAFLYKSHWILVDLKKRRPLRFSPLFVIPLGKSKILKDKKDFDGGLYSSYSKVIKIQFENGDCQMRFYAYFSAPKNVPYGPRN